MRALLQHAIIIGILAVIPVLAACGSGTVMTPTASTTDTTLLTITSSIPPATSTLPTIIAVPDGLLPPSIEELVTQGFALPNLPRITSERLKQMMNNGESFVLVDTRISFLFNLGNLPQSINIPIDLPEDDFIDRLVILPRDRPVILYCD